MKFVAGVTSTQYIFFTTITVVHIVHRFVIRVVTINQFDNTLRATRTRLHTLPAIVVFNY